MRQRKLRNLTRYNNQLLYFCFDAADYHFNNKQKEDPGGLFRNIPYLDCNGNRVRQLHRIQSLQYAINTNIEKLNQFGHLAFFDGAMASNPDVTLDFEYVLSDGYNESVMGFVLDGKHQALSKIMSQSVVSGSNLFLGVAPVGSSIGGADLSSFGDDFTSIGFGHCFFSQYAVTAQVGSVPKARVSFECFNINSNYGYKNLPSPALDLDHDCVSKMKYSLPDTYESFLYPKLKSLDQIEYKNLIGGIRPSDIKIYLGNSAMINKLLDSPGGSREGCANIQGFTINLPMGTTKVGKVGSILGFSRSLNFPTKIEIEVNAIMADLKQSESILTALCKQEPVDVVLDLLDCKSLMMCETDLENRTSSMRFVIKNVSQESESFSSNIGDNKSVNLKFSGTIAGPEDTRNGLFIEAKSFQPDRPRVVSWGQPL